MGRGESGQTLVLTVLFMMGLLGMCALTIDVGSLYQQRRMTQNAADAAALAGASAIPSGTYAAAAQRMAALNDKSGDQIAVTYNGTDSVTVKVSRQAPTYFLGMFGYKTVSVVSSATATIEATAQVHGHVSPYAVTRDAYANGTGTLLFQQNAPGAFGTIDLPTADNTSGGSCTGNTIKATPGNVRSILADTIDVGQLTYHGCLSVKSGAAQPAADVVNTLPGGLAADLKSLGNGEYELISQPWDDRNNMPPRLMYVPIVDSLPAGNGQAIVTGFAWFYMTGATNSGSDLVINGLYVTLQLPTTGQTIKYVPGMQGQIIMTGLTA